MNYSKRVQYATASILVPISIWGGIKLSNYNTSRQLEQISNNPTAAKISDSTLKAGIVQLAKERQTVLEELVTADERIREIKWQMEQQAARERPS